MKPFSQACENNKGPILEILQGEFADARNILEIGSGTGQHAVYFAPAMPWLVWQPSDLPENLGGLCAWTNTCQAVNLRPPIPLDVLREDWLDGKFDACFSANTAHIMHWPAVMAMFTGLNQVLEDVAVIALYGPFRFGGSHTAPSNETFDRWLRETDPGMGVRDAESLDELAHACGFRRSATHSMPANNWILVWRR